jgi:hypothetical protein
MAAVSISRGVLVVVVTIDDSAAAALVGARAATTRQLKLSCDKGGYCCDGLGSTARGVDCSHPIVVVVVVVVCVVWIATHYKYFFVFGLKTQEPR